MIRIFCYRVGYLLVLAYIFARYELTVFII